ETHDRGSSETASFVSGTRSLNGDGRLTMEVYLDRSVIEGFFNEDKAVSMRAYPTATDADGVSVFAEEGDATITELYVARMGSIYQP
ncbi:MAG: GH32 C-terminal domain-containing protein, partial [Lachnospiraceae bacterium]|nr:GH32 C-terminal domain-containing protein [Lachnospiraceae bacterium]